MPSESMTTGPHSRVTLSLMPPPAPEPVPPEVQLVVEPEGGAVAPGGTVTLTCEASTQPPPQIHWVKDVSDLGGRRELGQKAVSEDVDQDWMRCMDLSPFPHPGHPPAPSPQPSAAPP